MPADDTLPPSLLSALPELDQILGHFPAAFGVRVDTDRLDVLPSLEPQRYATARPPEPPEAALLDRVLQLVPRRFLHDVERIIVLPTRGTARPGGYLNGIVSVGASEADVRRPDPDFGNRFTVFTTTVVHEVGHAVFQTVLTPNQRDLVLDRYVRRLDALGVIPLGEPTQQGAEHFFVDYFLPAVLRFGSHARGAAASRRALAEFGMDLSDR
jgi:hypothetical protein